VHDSAAAQPSASTIETAPRETHVAAIDRATGNARRFVVTLIAGTVAIVIAVGGTNALVDPFGGIGTGLLPTILASDKPEKVALIDNLRSAPQIVVYGSSRATKVQPTYLKQKLGQTGFNAAVSAANPRDVWSIANLIHSRFPHAHEHVLWVLDIEAFQSVALDPGDLDTPQLARYYPLSERLRARLDAIYPLLSWTTLHDSLHVLRLRFFGGLPKPQVNFAPDGFRIRAYHGFLNSKSDAFPDELRATIAQWTKMFEFEYPRLSPTQKHYFEKTLAAFNSWGEDPVIVLSPLEPALKKVIGPLGWDARHRDVLAYLKSLHAKYRFTVIDMTSLSSFGGSPNQFYDGIHMKVPNVRLMLNAVIKQARGKL
jgi:hypothetical protein